MDLRGSITVQAKQKFPGQFKDYLYVFPASVDFIQRRQDER